MGWCWQKHPDGGSTKLYLIHHQAHVLDSADRCPSAAPSDPLGITCHGPGPTYANPAVLVAPSSVRALASSCGHKPQYLQCSAALGVFPLTLRHDRLWDTLDTCTEWKNKGVNAQNLSPMGDRSQGQISFSSFFL